MLGAKSKVVVDLFYDVASPYTWIGFEAITRYQHKWKSMDLHLRPVLLGAILKANGALAPSPARAKFSKVELQLTSEYFDLPFKRPSSIQHVLFQKGTLQPQRLLTAVAHHQPSLLEAISRQLFMNIWVKDVDATEPESLRTACLASGLQSREADCLLDLIKTDSVKKVLKNTTQIALDHGAFGAPTFVAHLPSGPVMLFGSDKLFLLAHLLDEKWLGPLNELNQVKL